VFLVSTSSKLYLWIGTGTPLNLKREAMAAATKYLTAVS
jgi:hypothetical protein